MTKQLAERLRVAYASGLYTKYSLWDSYRHEVTAQELEQVLDYTTFPDVRTDLVGAMGCLDKDRAIFSAYQHELRGEASTCQRYELMGRKYNYESRKEQLDAIYLEGLSTPIQSLVASLD